MPTTYQDHGGRTVETVHDGPTPPANDTKAPTATPAVKAATEPMRARPAKATPAVKAATTQRKARVAGKHKR